MEVPAPDIKTSDTPIESSEADWRRYLFLREEMRHEDQLINQRLSWLIGSQAFLLGGFATLIATGANVPASPLGRIKDTMLIGLPIAGILGVMTNYVTILAAVMHVRGIRKLAADRAPERM